MPNRHLVTARGLPGLWCLLAVLLPPLARGGPCVDYGDHLRLTHSEFLATFVADIVVVDDVAVVTLGDEGLATYDIGDPDAPVRLGSYTTSGWYYGVALKGDLALVASLYEGLVILDISDPVSPALVSLTAVSDFAVDVTVAGGFAFLTDALEGLIIVDVSDVHNPQPSGMYGSLGTIYRNAAVGGALACLAGAEDGVAILAVSDPTAPQLLTVLPSAGSSEFVTLAENLLYVAEGAAGLRVVDITDPALPVVLALQPTMNQALRVVVRDQRAYVADGGEGLMVIDVTSPAQPQVLGSVELPGITAGLAVLAEHVLVGSSDAVDHLDMGLHTVTCGNGTSPAEIASLAAPTNAHELALAGDLAYVANGVDGLQIVDLSVPAAPVLLSSLATPDRAHDIAVSGSYAFIAAEDAGLLVVDVADPVHPEIVASVPPAHAAWGVAVAADRAYVTDSNELMIVDVSTPAAPVVLASGIGVGGDAIVVQDGIAYVHTFGFLRAYDVSDPDTAGLVGFLAIAGQVVGMAVVDDLLYLAASRTGLIMVDVSDPTQPTQVATINTPDKAWDVVVAAPYAYVCDYWGGLHVFDVGVPASPTVVGSLNTPGRSWGVALRDDAVVLAEFGFGLRILPRQCTLVGVTDSGNPVDPAGPKPASSHRLTAHPNPLNPRTMISFTLERDGWGRVGIFTLAGRRVAVLADRRFPAGEHALFWDGRDGAGRALPSGAYLARLETDTGVQARKVAVVR